MSQTTTINGGETRVETNRMSRVQVLWALKCHSIKAAEFDADHPVAAEYRTDVVMLWMGY